MQSTLTQKRNRRLRRNEPGRKNDRSKRGCDERLLSRSQGTLLPSQKVRDQRILLVNDTTSIERITGILYPPGSRSGSRIMLLRLMILCFCIQDCIYSGLQIWDAGSG